MRIGVGEGTVRDAVATAFLAADAADDGIQDRDGDSATEGGEDAAQLTLDELHERNRPPSTKPVAVRLPEPLLDDVDEVWDGEYDTRSEFVSTLLQHVVANPEEFQDLDDPEEGPGGL